MEKETSTAADRENYLEITVTGIIQQMGIPVHIKGFRFLRRAIILCVENNEMIYSFTKLLYPAVAAEFNTTPARVESNISRAIEIACDKGNAEMFRSYFGNTIDKTRGRPTNTEFISLIADMLRLQLKNLSPQDIERALSSNFADSSV